ncbi:MAG: TetR/AcrR family transcriptional regulator [Gammaproteobacteria bacterium]|jgi:AcrR family transcriptional regulator|nr:TetR/AcrR family transcriptional regulator [Gammaproteobacteria bacterium]
MSEDLALNKPRRRNTKEKIIDEAESLAALHGIEHLKLQDVADKIGIKLPSVYAHFSGREDILAAMGARISKGIGQLYIARTGETPIETLKRSAQDLLKMLGEHPAYFRLMLRDHSVPMGYDPLNHRAAVNQNFALPNDMRDMLVRLQHLIDKACKDGVKLSAEDFAGCVHGFMLVRLSWLPTRVSEDGHVYVDHTLLQSTLDQIINRLLCV